MTYKGIAEWLAITLTNSATPDAIIGTSGNDTINGPSGTVANADLIIDQSTTDIDTANLVLTAAYTPDNITNIEKVNLDWDAFGTATYNLTNVKGAKTVTLTSSKVGYLGNATVTNANAIDLVAGAGTVGTFNASGFKTGSVDTGSAKTVVVDGSTTNSNNESITVTVGDAATSVSVGVTNGFKAATVNAGKATTIDINDAGNTTDTTALTVNANATITSSTQLLGALTLTASDTNKISLSTIGASLTVKGTGAVEITANGALTGETVTNGMDAGSTLTLKENTAGALNLAKVQATTIELTAAKTAADTVANGANLKYSAAGTDVRVTVGGTGTADAVTAEVTAATVDDLISAGVETLTIKANATQVSGADITIAIADTGGANTIKLTGTNDVTVGTLNGAAGTLDASALAGDLVVGATGAVSTSVKGGTGKLNFTYSGTTQDGVAIGQSADDTVTANGVNTGSMTAILGDGKNTVSATGLQSGTLVVTGGSGIDTVTAGAALTTGVINLNLGDGANVINLDDAAGAGTREVTTGGGDDTLTFTGGLDDANDVLKWTAGAGNDTLVLATEGADISGSKVTLSSVETIKVATDTDTDLTTATATLAASNLSGSTLTVKAASYDANNSIAIKGAATTTTIDLSGVTIDQSITAGIARVYIDAAANTTTSQTITGTAVADWITGGDKADTIFGGKGEDVITGGEGNDIIDLTEATADQVKDLVTFIARDDNGSDTIKGFKSGTDQLNLFGQAETTVGTGTGAAVVDFFATALTAGASAYVLGAGTSAKTTATADVLVISTTLSSNGNLALGTDGTELLKALSSTSTAATQITAANSGDDFYLVAYQNGNAYLYQVTNGADTAVIASEIKLIGTLEGITAGSLAAADFLVQ